jgi:hypothetical protein
MAAPVYEWFLCESPSLDDPFAPLEKIAPLQQAKNRTYTLTKNRAGSAEFTLKTSDKILESIMDRVEFNDIRGTVRKCIRIRRNGQDLWSGPIWGIQGSLAQDSITFSCVGWLEELQYRFIWAAARDYTNAGAGYPADEIAFGLLNDANYISDPSTPGGTVLDDTHPVLIQPGTVSGSMPPFVRYYQQGQVVGAAIQNMSDIENGYDMEVDPVTRALNLTNWQEYDVLENVVLGYNWGPNNLMDFSWQEDPSQMGNYDAISTSLGTGFTVCYDSESEDIYNRFDYSTSLNNAAIQDLAPYGMAQLAVYRFPFLTYTLTPFPRTQDGNGPSLFDDYQLGDQITVNAQKNYFKLVNLPMRVFGATVNLDDNGNETVSALQTTPASGS